MKKQLLCTIVILGTLCISSFKPKDEWTILLDQKLSNWEIYQSFPFTINSSKTPKDEQGNDLKPVGYNKNQDNEFSIVMQNDEPVLHINGPLYGCIYTKQEFENYDLKLKVKWGDKKYSPRLDQLKDSGVLYHSLGECGAETWHTWMLSQEFQIQENSMGDYWSQASSMADIRAVKEDKYKFDNSGDKVSFGTGTSNGNFCRSGSNAEIKGEWNDIELIAYGDKSLQIVNGVVVNALSNMRYRSGDKVLPLTKGKIQLQAEAAEVYYKDIRIKSIDGIPANYGKYFN